MIVGVWSSAAGADLDGRVQRLEARFGRARHRERRGAGMLLGWMPGAWSAGESERPDRLAVGHDQNLAWIGWHRAHGLVCGRGPLGGEPLYWADDEGACVVASRLEALVVALGERLSVDDDYVDGVVASLPALDPRATPYRRIRRLLSGEQRVLSSSRPAEPAVFEGAAPARARGGLEDLDGSDDDLADALWTAAYESVARAAAGVRVLGVLAGGGLDSSGLLAAAVAHARDRGDLEVIPIALDFAARGDDRPHLRATAEWLGVDPVRVPPEEAAPFVHASLVVDARPSLEASLPLLAAAAVAGKQRGVQKIVTGFLGDLILDAPGGATLARMRAGGPIEQVRAVVEAARVRDPWRSHPLELVWRGVLAPLLRPWAPRALLHARRRRGYRALLPWAGPRLHAFFAERAERAAERPALAIADQRFAALGSNLQMVDQVDTRVQVELLSGVSFSEPWMDAEFCRSLARIPPWRLAARGRERGLFRHALRGRLPETVRLRPDKAMMEPALDRMLVAAGGERAFAHLLEARRLVARGFVDARELGKVVRRFFARGPGDDGGDAWTTLWSVAAAEAFLERAAADGRAGGS